MLTTMRITTEISPNREVRITLPEEIPVGPVELVVIVAPAEAPIGQTFGDLLRSDYIGMWRDRTDIDDSAAFARQLRAEAWSRSQ